MIGVDQGHTHRNNNTASPETGSMPFYEGGTTTAPPPAGAQTLPITGSASGWLLAGTAAAATAATAREVLRSAGE